MLEVSRSTLYYTPLGESDENLEIMRLMDAYHIEHPTTGVLGMQDMLKYEGYLANHKRIRRLLRMMDIRAIYPLGISFFDKFVIIIETDIHGTEAF